MEPDEQKKVVAVIGTTGVGKSQLGIELAQHFSGEILSVDSLQVYRGLQIATNKVTQQERELVPHHLLDIRNPDEEYTVHDFCHDAEAKITELHNANKLPILVGGTHYYLQSLLWNDIFTEQSVNNEIEDDSDSEASSAQYSYERLQQIDPVMASKFHANDKRRIKRSLKIFEQTGRRQSDTLLERENKQRRLRYRVCFFWLAADTTALDKRLDKRVDSMLEAGLLTELKTLHSQYAQQGVLDYSRGIFQAIGFKEFDPLFSVVGDQSRDDQTVVKENCLDKMRSATRNYARRQISWITNRLWNALQSTDASDYHFHVLNATDLSTWQTNVRDQGIKLLTAFLQNNDAESLNPSCPYVPLLLSRRAAEHASLMTWKKYNCDVCHRTVNGEREWTAHLLSRGHRRGKQKLKANEKNKAQID